MGEADRFGDENGKRERFGFRYGYSTAVFGVNG